jgi:8-hydroxy-5-deazaflavin:NADPH oxidoreductase
LYLIAETFPEREDWIMNICILGFGNVGSRLAHLWSEAGHTLSVGLRSNSKHRDAARKAGFTVSEPHIAVQSADVVAVAVPWEAVKDALSNAGPLDGKILIDATNPLNSDLRVLTPKEGSSAQQIVAWFPAARVVKAFNTIGAANMGNSAFDLYYCSDDKEAAEIVHGLIKETGMRPVNAGPLHNAGYLEHLAGLWIFLAMSGQIQGAFGFNLVEDNP